MEEPQVRFAPQDAPVPEPDPTLLPPDAYYVSDADAYLVLHQGYARPSAHTLGDTVLAMADEYNLSHSAILIREFWKGVKPGCALFVPKDFKVQVTDVNPARAHIEGYKKYTK
jgi:hypothetical protein